MLTVGCGANRIRFSIKDSTMEMSFRELTEKPASGFEPAVQE
jgi:hypothetical protein